MKLNLIFVKIKLVIKKNFKSNRKRVPPHPFLSFNSFKLNLNNKKIKKLLIFFLILNIQLKLIQ